MSINPTVTVKDKDGMVKRIAANKIQRDMRSDACWYSADAVEITSIPHTLSNPNLEWIVLDRNTSVIIEFVPDGAADDGQGFSTFGGAAMWTVETVEGDVYILRSKFIDLSMQKADCWASSSKVSAQVGDKLLSGDIILCAKDDASFNVTVSAPTSVSGGYVSIGIVQASLY